MRLQLLSGWRRRAQSAGRLSTRPADALAKLVFNYTNGPTQPAQLCARHRGPTLAGRLAAVALAQPAPKHFLAAHSFIYSSIHLFLRRFGS